MGSEAGDPSVAGESGSTVRLGMDGTSSEEEKGNSE